MRRLGFSAILQLSLSCFILGQECIVEKCDDCVSILSASNIPASSLVGSITMISGLCSEHRDQNSSIASALPQDPEFFPMGKDRCKSFRWFIWLLPLYSKTIDAYICLFHYSKISVIPHMCMEFYRPSTMTQCPTFFIIRRERHPTAQQFPPASFRFFALPLRSPESSAFSFYEACEAVSAKGFPAFSPLTP